MAFEKVLQLITGRKKEKSIRVGFPVYDSSGEITSPKIWVGQVTTNASGTATLTYSSAGFSTILSIQLTCVENGSGVTTASHACITSTPSTSSCNIITLESKNTTVVILNTNVEGLEVSANTTVYATVVGT